MESINVSKAILEKALCKGLQTSDVEVVSATIFFPNRKGVNFLSDLFKVAVRYTLPSKAQGSPDSERIVVKAEPLKVKSALEIVQKQELFSTELRVLRDVLPKIEKIIGGQIGPSLWYACDTLKMLMMEDLTLKGFTMKNRQTGLSFDDCDLAMEQLAKMHAGSVALREKEPQVIAWFKHRGVVSAKCPQPYLRFMKSSLINISETVSTWDDDGAKSIALKLKNLSKTVIPRCREAYACDTDEFCVLNHGDCWTNNMMFKTDENGKACGLRFVDYQMATYASPAIDLLYFLYTCPEISIKCDKDEYFFERYLTILSETMTDIGCRTRPPTMEQLREAIHKRRIYAVFAGIILCLRMIANEEDIEDFDLLLCERNGETQMDVFKNPSATEAARKMLFVMNERGYLD